MSEEFNPSADVVKRVETALGDTIICQQCGATLETYAEKCAVSLDVKCEGFRIVEASLSESKSP